MKYSIVLRQCACCGILHKVFLVNDVFRVWSQYAFSCAVTGKTSSFKADIQVFDDGHAVISDVAPDCSTLPALKKVTHSMMAKMV